MDFRYIDTHGHLNDSAFDTDRENILNELIKEKIATTIVGTDFEMSKKAIEISDRENGRYAIIGQHPFDENFEEFEVNQYTKWASNENVVAIGECGLDYFWPESRDWNMGENEEKKRQLELFLKQISIARGVNKPLVIHGRPSKGKMDAYSDILGLLESESSKNGAEIKGVAHFFAGDIDIAKKFLDLGFNLSFTGVITFVNDYDEIIKYVPKDRIMAETDSPYVAPKPYRGKRNEPKYVIEVYKKIAEIKGIDSEVMRMQLNDNAINFFNLKNK